MFRRFAPLCVIAWMVCAIEARALDLEPIPPERPWLIFRAPDPGTGDTLAYADLLKQVWSGLPEVYRAQSALEVIGPRIGVPGWAERFNDVVNELQFAEIPAVVTITSSPATAAPLDEVQAMFDKFTAVRAVRVSGLRFDEYPAFAPTTSMGTPPQAAWLASLIELAAQYGRRVILEVDGLEWPRLMANTRDARIYEAMRQHPAVVVPINSGRAPHTIVASGALMGLWLEGAAAQWGVRCDSGWYASANFIEPGKFGVSPDAQMPPSLYRAKSETTVPLQSIIALNSSMRSDAKS